jgi:3-oxoacyl-[acyl-carrier protein] reductase
MELGLTGKTVLVTGASSGIGRATALAFADEKAHIAVGYHTNRQAAEETAALAEKRGARAICWQLSLGQPDELEAAVAHARRELGPISVLANNAVRWPGWPDPGELFETAPPERFTSSVNANLIGPYLLARAVVADMREHHWGRIVNVSTGLVEDGFPHSAAYIAAKSGCMASPASCPANWPLTASSPTSSCPASRPPTSSYRPSSSTRPAAPPQPRPSPTPTTSPA